MKIKFLIFFSIILFQSCYTVVDQNKLNFDSQSTKYAFPSNAIIETKLNGTWINPVRWMDYGDQLRKLEMFYDGNFIYTPSSEKNNSEYFYGQYRSIADTLVFLFEVNNRIEKINFSVANDTLFLISLSLNENTRNNLINNCSGCVKAWHKLK